MEAYRASATSVSICRPLVVTLARSFASTGSLSARLLRFACHRSSSLARSLAIGDVLKVVARLNDDGGTVKRHTSLTRDVACRPERQLLQEDETNRRATISVRIGLKLTDAVEKVEN
jgi:hypothetical protein